MTKIGLLSKHLIEEVVSQANDLLESNDDMDVIYFVQNQTISKQIPSFAVMTIGEAYDYDGIMIAFDYESAMQLLRFPGAKQRLYFLATPEWAMKNTSHTELAKVFESDRLQFVTNQHEIVHLLKYLWGQPCKLLSNDYLKDIYEKNKNLLSD